MRKRGYLRPTTPSPVSSMNTMARLARTCLYQAAIDTMGTNLQGQYDCNKLLLALGEHVLDEAEACPDQHNGAEEQHATGAEAVRRAEKK